MQILVGRCLAVAAVLFPLAARAEPAATPEEAVSRMEEAIRAADVDAVLAVCSSVFTKFLTENYDQRQQRHKARAALDDALDAKFGPDKADRKPFVPQAFHEGFKDELTRDAARLEKLVIESSEPPPADRKSVTDRVELRVRFQEKREARKDDKRDPKAKPEVKPLMKRKEPKADPWVATKEEGGWRLCPKEIAEARANDVGRQVLADHIAKCERVAKEVAAGRYATRADALDALYGFRREDFDLKKDDSPRKDEPKK